MSGLTISEIREALATQINNNTDADISVHAYPVGNVTTPAITVDFPDGDYVEYWNTYGPAGLATVRFTLRLEPGGLFKDSTSEGLDAYLSVGTGNGYSVVDALMADSSLGLTGCNAHIGAARVDTTTVTAELDVEVRVSKQGANV